MFINCDESRLFVDDKPLENVKSFVYLGSTISQKKNRFGKCQFREAPEVFVG